MSQFTPEVVSSELANYFFHSSVPMQAGHDILRKLIEPNVIVLGTPAKLDKALETVADDITEAFATVGATNEELVEGAKLLLKNSTELLERISNASAEEVLAIVKGSMNKTIH